MPEQHHRPVRRPTSAFDNLVGSHDPAEETRVAHATASALLTRVRADESGVSAERLVAFTAEHGIDEIAELWSKAPSRTLPGALWRLYVLQLAIHGDPQTAALLYERGRVELASADAVIAGAPVPANPDELVALIDTILRGAFGATSRSRSTGRRRSAACRRRVPRTWPTTTRRRNRRGRVSSPRGR